MGLFDRFFGGKKEEETFIRADELDGFILELEKKEEESVSRKARPILEDIARVIVKMKEETLSIDSSDSLEDSPNRLESVLKTTKPSFVKSMMDYLSELEKPPVGLEANEYLKKLDGFIFAAPKLMAGQGKYLRFSFGEQLGEMGKDLRILLDYRNELFELFNQDLIHGINADRRTLAEAVSRKNELMKEGAGLNKTLGEKEKRQKDLKERYESLEETESYKEHNEHEQTLEETVKDRERLENELFTLFAPLRKTLKQIKHSRMKLKDLESFIEKPVEEYVSRDIAESRDFFQTVKELIRKEDLGLSEDKKGKTISRIDEILSPETEKTRLGLKWLADKEREGHQCIRESTYLREKQEIEKEMERAEREERHCRGEYEKITNKSKQKNEEIIVLKSRIEDKLRKITGKKVVLGF